MASRRVAACCAALLLGLGTLGAVAARPGPKEAVNEAQLRELRGRIEKLQAEMAASEKGSAEAVDQLRESDRALSEAHRALFDVMQGRAAIDTRLAEIAAQAAELRQAARRHEDLAAELLRLQHRQGAPDRLRLALEGRDAATVARHMAYYGYIQRSRAAVIAQLRAQRDALAALELDAAQRREELARAQAAQADEARRLERERAARHALAQKLAADIERSRREMGRLKRDEARLARLVEEIGRALSATPKSSRKSAAGAAKVDQVADATTASVPFMDLKGRLRLPVRGELAHRYGASRDPAGGAWKGLFIRSTTGETVRAVADGVVVYADWLRGFGNLLILDHGRGFMSLYGYNEGLLRAVGEKVRSGDPIASVGATGSEQISGLYFELRREGKPFDPMSWVAQQAP